MEQPPVWHFDSKVRENAALGDKRYVLFHASPQDFQKVVEYYQHGPVEGYEVNTVEVIDNPRFNQIFDLEIGRLQEKEGNPAFEPQWQSMAGSKDRQKVDEAFKGFTQPYIDPHFPSVKLLPGWHGTKLAYLDSIFRVGYSNLSYTDNGYFGKGLYSSREADYAYRTYSQGALIVNWVATYSTLPVIEEDMPLLRGKSNYGPYDAHFVPVKPLNPHNPQEKVYYPCKPGEEKYHELVVFQTSACLPRYLVQLQKTLLKTPAVKPAGGVFSFSWAQAFQCCHQVLWDEKTQLLHLTFPVPSQTYWPVWHEHISTVCESLKEKTEETLEQSRTPDDQIQIISLKAQPETLALYKSLPEEKKESLAKTDISRWIFIKAHQKTSLFFQTNPHTQFYQALATALEMQNKKKVENLLKEGKPLLAYQDDKGNRFMHLLAQTALIGYVQPFLQWGFQLTVPNHFGDIPLHYACNRENHTRDPEGKMVKALIAVGSPLDIPNKQLQTPLMVAAKDGHIEAVKALLKAGADPKLVDQNGQTALQLAQASGLPPASPVITILSACETKNCLIQ